MLVILVLAFIFLKLGYGITGVMLAYTLVYILPLLIYYPLFKKRVFPEFSKIKAGIKLETAKKLLKFGIPLTIAGTASIIFGYMDTVIITFFRSLEEVALYNVGLPTIRLMWNFERALTVVLLPIAIELWVQKDKERFNRGINNIYKYILTLTIPFIIIMLVFPELILKVLFGPDYVGAATVVRILAVASIIIVLARINVALITGIGKPSIISKIMIIGALINLAVNLILIPLIGINGAAISTAAAFSVILVYTHKKLKEKTQIKLPFKTILKILMAGIITIPIIYILKSVINTNVYLEAIIVVAISLGIYYMLIVNFGVIKLKEVKKLISKLKPTSKTP